MALFKVSKGASNGLSNQALGDGFCWFTYDDGKFYIDYKDPTDDIVKRKALNANRADADSLGNILNSSYAASLNFTNNTLSLLAKNGTTLTTVALSTMVGATNNTAGGSGLVPAPAAGDNTKFLRGDASWGEATLVTLKTWTAS